MKVYTRSDGSPFDFVGLDGTKYPANWLQLATQDDLAQAGITVTEVPDPPPPPAPPPTYSAEDFLQMFTPQERRGIEAAALADPALEDFVVQLEAAGSFQLGNPLIVQGLQYIFSKNLLTADRANEIAGAQIVTPPAPPSTPPPSAP